MVKDREAWRAAVQQQFPLILIMLDGSSVQKNIGTFDRMNRL